MRPAAPDPLIPRLLERLRRARARARAALLLRAALWLAAAAAAAALAGAVAAELGRPLPPAAGAWAAVLLATAALATLALAWRRSPDLALVARRADARFGLRERAGTALELSRAGARRAAAGPLAAELLRDAERHADRIDPRRLVPLRVPRVAALALGLVAATAVVQLVGLPSWGTGSAPLPLPLTGAQAEVTSVNLRRAAELLERNAQRSEDPYLQALARAFEELGRQVEAGTLDRTEVEREVDRLLEHAERAFEGEADSPLRAEEPGETAERGPRPDPAAGPEPEAAEAPAAGAPAEAAPRTEPEERTRGLTGLDTFVERLERIETAAQEEAAAREARAGRVTGAEFNYGFDRPERSQRRPDEGRDPRDVPPQDFVGVPIGAAEQANEGAGDLAGRGVMELAGEEAAAANPLAGEPGAQTEEVYLPDAGMDGGERVQMEVPPETRRTEVDGAPVAAAPPEAREAEVRRDRIAPRDREIVSRYFDRATPRAPDTP